MSWELAACDQAHQNARATGNFDPCKTRRRLRQRPAPDTQDLLPPRIQQPAADCVLARHRRRRRSRLQALLDNLARLFGRPNPSALTARDQLDARSAPALTTYRMSVLIIRRRQRGRIHASMPRLPSQQLHVPQCVSPKPPTYYLAGYIQHAQAAQLQRHVDPDIVFHGRPSLMAGPEPLGPARPAITLKTNRTGTSANPMPAHYGIYRPPRPGTISPERHCRCPPSDGF